MGGALHAEFRSRAFGGSLAWVNVRLDFGLIRALEYRSLEKLQSFVVGDISQLPATATDWSTGFSDNRSEGPITNQGT